MSTSYRRAVGRKVAVALFAGVVSFLVSVPAAMAAAPTISSFSPTSGVVGTEVTITGSGFQDTSVVTGVTFDGVSATFTVDSNVQITATVPATATTGPIAVIDSEGTFTSAADFTVNPSPVPTISSFDPTTGVVGDSVTITGTGFVGATAVAFDGVAAVSFAVVSDTQVTAVVPSGATTGPITVTTPGGTATSAADFTVGTPTVRHDRSVTLNLSKHLLAKGLVRSGSDACESNVTVKIQRWRNGNWRTVERDETNAAGAYRERLADREGRYRVLVAKQTTGDDICVRDVSPTRRHRH